MQSRTHSENSAVYQTMPLPLCQPAGNWTQTTANAYTATNNAATQDTVKEHTRQQASFVT